MIACRGVPLFGRGVACYARNSWQRHAMVIDTTNPPMRLTAQGVACCAPTDPIGGTSCRGAGVARYTPTREDNQGGCVS